MSGQVVFAGPSLVGSSLRSRVAADWWPPAGAGDVAAACAAGARTLVILDTACGWRPGPRHREVMAALAGGVRVHGAAGGGALLAVELQAFGMLGHGQIFARWRDGEGLGDDAVACDHDAALDLRRSEPLVQVVHVLAAARRSGAIDDEDEAALRRAADELHWLTRDWPRICARAGRDSRLAALLEVAAAPGGDLPRADAEALLEEFAAL